MWKARLLVVALALGLLTCHGALFTAPPGSSITLNANPTFISANGGSSLITALVLEPAQTLVPDGTVILFFTDLGRIEEQVKTRDGIARVNLIADSRSGVAHVRAFAGGAPAPVPTGSPSPGPGGTSGSGSAQVDITIGNLNAVRLLLTANPNRIDASRFTYVTATVFDDKGNPVQSAPVFFAVDANPSTESFDSGGAPIFTDNDGRATDTLRTRRPVSPGTTRAATVSARVPAGGTSFVNATLNIPID